jgi:hypothetical protein
MPNSSHLKTIYNMELHEVIDATTSGDHSQVLCKRVASGWIYYSLIRDHVTGYDYQKNPVFVPFDNKFQGASNV